MDKYFYPYSIQHDCKRYVDMLPNLFFKTRDRIHICKIFSLKTFAYTDYFIVFDERKDSQC